MKKMFTDVSQRSSKIIKNSFLRWFLKNFMYIMWFAWINIIGMCWYIIVFRLFDFITLIGILVGAVGIPQMFGLWIKKGQAQIENGTMNYKTYNGDNAIKEITEGGK